MYGTVDISLDDARIEIEALDFNFIYSWLIKQETADILQLFASDFNVTIDDQTDSTIDLLLIFKDSLDITDGDLITDSIDISYSNIDKVIISESGHYYFYNANNEILDAGIYETKWLLNPQTAPKYVIRSISFDTFVSNQNEENLYFDEHEMGTLWVRFWDNLHDLDDKSDENTINHFLSPFSDNFEFNFVDTMDIERVLYGKQSLLEWMNNYHGQGIYGAERLIAHKNENVIMFKLSPWQSVFEADVVLLDRKTNAVLMEERWHIIMGYDVMNRQFYRTTQFYDQHLFLKEINQIQPRFPFARDKPPSKREL